MSRNDGSDIVARHRLLAEMSAQREHEKRMGNPPLTPTQRKLVDEKMADMKDPAARISYAREHALETLSDKLAEDRGLVTARQDYRAVWEKDPDNAPGFQKWRRRF